MKVLNLKEVQQVSGAGFDLYFTLEMSGIDTVTDANVVMAALQKFINDPTQGQAFIDTLQSHAPNIIQFTLKNICLTNFDPFEFVPDFCG